LPINPQETPKGEVPRNVFGAKGSGTSLAIGEGTLGGVIARPGDQCLFKGNCQDCRILAIEGVFGLRSARDLIPQLDSAIKVRVAIVQGREELDQDSVA
jgi:hypothetical protein